MKKKYQVRLTDEAHLHVETLTKEANENFDVGRINYSDVVNELILSGKLDFKALQSKHTDIRRSLRKIASKADLDLDSAIKTLLELKSKTSGKRTAKTNSGSEEVI